MATLHNQPHARETARALFLEHCQPGSRGTLERYGEGPAVSAILEAVGVFERNDVRYVLICNPTDNDGGLAYLIGHDGVTEMRIVKRKGPLDWIPYIAVYRGDAIYAEIPQHNALCVEFLVQS